MESLRGGILVLVLALSGAAAGDQGQDKPATPAEQYQALLKENQDAFKAFAKAYAAAKTDEERKKVVKEKSPQALVDKLAPRFLELAEQNPKDPVAVDALVVRQA